MIFKRIKSYVVVTISIALLTVGFYQNYYKKNDHGKSISNSLQFYGFETQEKEKAFEYLFKIATAIPIDTPWKQIFPVRKNDNELAHDFLEMLEQIHKRITIKTGVQEHWETQSTRWIKNDNEKISLNLKILGFLEAIKPKNEAPDVICILGATRSRMADRIKYAEELIKAGLKTKFFVLLAGERQVIKDVDGSKNELIRIAKNFGIKDWKKLTETHLIRNLYKQSKLLTQGIPFCVIDTPAKKLPRPTTRTTMIEFISWLKKHPEMQSVLFISNQPYVQYQNAIISSIFEEEKIKIQYEVVGSSAKKNNNLYQNLEAFFIFIWAATPSVIEKIHLNLSKEKELQHSFEGIYAKNPLIYDRLPII